MIVLKMSASFGKLHDTLTLHEGMNLLCLPNESGKSTWSAFLLSMLYGIDTGERAGKTNQGLPAKERYKPWNGSAMEGSMEVLWQGRRITIERTSAGRTPMGVFRAYETESGVPVTELTAENCGRLLCGVERSVYERTAFIRQLGLPVSGDAALEQRLNALVTTGEEGKSYTELEKELRNLKNKCSFRATGQIARLQSRKTEVERQLSELRAAQDEAMRLSAECEELNQKKEQLDVLKARTERAHSAKRRAGLAEMIQRLHAQETLCSRMQETCDTLPEESELRDLHRKLENAENDLRTAQMEAAFASTEVAKPPAPACFSGLSGPQAKEKAAKALEEYETLSSVKEPNRLLPLMVCAIVLLAGVGLCFLNLYLGLGVAAAGLLAILAVLVVLSRRTASVREQRHRADLIPARYGVAKPEEMGALAEDYATQLAAYEAEKAEADAQKQVYAERTETIRRRIDELVRQVRQFASQCATAEECRIAIDTALRARERLAAEQRTLDALRQQCGSMQMILGDAPEEPEDTEALRYDPQEVSRACDAAADRLAQLRAQLAHKRGQISARGDAVALEAELETITQQLITAQETNDALELAMAALKSADESLRARFSPQITADAGVLLAELTGGKYPNVLLESDMRMSVRESSGVVMRPAAAMSCGTSDQMYLALRLAMCRRLLPQDAPLLLDDALVNFDADRTAAALRVLRREAKNRQVILFTCREIDKSSEE